LEFKKDWNLFLIVGIWSRGFGIKKIGI